MYYIATKSGTDYLIHHGIKGQKWGVRRYQNEDGSLKPAGLKRYSKETSKELNRLEKQRIRAEENNMSNILTAFSSTTKDEMKYNREQMKRSGKEVRNIERQINKLIKDVESKGLNVSYKSISNYSGKERAKRFLTNVFTPWNAVPSKLYDKRRKYSIT